MGLNACLGFLLVKPKQLQQPISLIQEQVFLNMKNLENLKAVIKTLSEWKKKNDPKTCKVEKPLSQQQIKLITCHKQK